MTDLNDLYEAILNGKHNVALEVTKSALSENISPKVLIDDYLIKAMEEIGRRFEQHKVFVPELLMAGRAMKMSLSLIQPLLKGENTSLMLGESLLLAPSLFPGQIKRAAYFPDGFYGYFDGKHYDKGYHLIDCSLDDIPLFVRDHSLLCLNPVGTKSTAYSDVLRLYWTMDEAATYHYEDDGDTLAYQKGAYNLFLLRADREKGVCVIPVHLGISTHYAKIEIDTPDGGHFVSDFSLKGNRAKISLN